MAKAEYRSAIRSRKLISMALVDLLQEKPLDKITVTDVVRRAEVNRGTFYAHYSDIQDVINHIIEETFVHIKEKVFDGHKDISDIPHVLVEIAKEIVEGNNDFCRKVMSSSASAFMEDQLVKLICEYLVQHQSKFSKGDREQYVLKIHFCAGGLSNLYKDWFEGKLSVSLDGLTKQAETFLNRIFIDAVPVC